MTLFLACPAVIITASWCSYTILQSLSCCYFSFFFFSSSSAVAMTSVAGVDKRDIFSFLLCLSWHYWRSAFEFVLFFCVCVCFFSCCNVFFHCCVSLFWSFVLNLYFWDVFSPHNCVENIMRCAFIRDVFTLTWVLFCNKLGQFIYSIYLQRSVFDLDETSGKQVFSWIFHFLVGVVLYTVWIFYHANLKIMKIDNDNSNNCLFPSVELYCFFLTFEMNLNLHRPWTQIHINYVYKPLSFSNTNVCK